MSANATLPPGPRQPSAMQTIAWWSRPVSFLERCRRAYGNRFTVRLLATPPFVMIADPDQVQADLHRRRRSPPSRRGRAHPRARRREQLRDPARRARPPRAAQADAAGLPRREDAAPRRHHAGGRRTRGRAWPTDRPVVLHPRFQALTLEVILRAVFGLGSGPHLDGLRERLTDPALGAQPAAMLPVPPARQGLGALRAPAGRGRQPDLRPDRRAARGRRRT